MKIEQVALEVIDRLNRAGIAYALVGAFSSSYWGIPRATKDADFVVQLSGPEISRLWDIFQPDFVVSDQMTFETITGSRKLEIRHPEAAFIVELFMLSTDPHHQERFGRRKLVQVFGRDVWMPTPEDVIIQKIRWARTKDLDDAMNVLAVQGDALDFAYIRKWCESHVTLERLERLIASIPEI